MRLAAESEALVRRVLKRLGFVEEDR